MQQSKLLPMEDQQDLEDLGVLLLQDGIVERIGSIPGLPEAAAAVAVVAAAMPELLSEQVEPVVEAAEAAEAVEHLLKKQNQRNRRTGNIQMLPVETVAMEVIKEAVETVV